MTLFLSPIKKLSILALMLMSIATPVQALVLNLENESIRMLIDVVSKATGKNFVIDPRVANTSNVTVVSNRELNDDELYETFLSILQVHGYAVVETGLISKIVPLNKALAETHPLTDKPEDEPSEKLITRLIPIKNVSSLSISSSLRTLTRNVKIQHHAESNSILLSGRVADIERVNVLIQRMDRSNEKHIEIVPLRYADAQDVVKTIQDLNKSSKGGLGKFVRRGDKISADTRTNSILVSGDAVTRQRIRAIVKKLDVVKKKSGNVEVVPLKYADAEKMVQIIQALNKATSVVGADAKSIVQQNDKISADSRTNSLIISGDEITRQRFRLIIRKLDIPKKQEGRTKVVYLHYAKATELVKVLQGLSKTAVIANAEGKASAVNVANASGVSSVDIQADEATNSLIITAEPAVYANLHRVIQKLDMRRAQVMIETIIAEVGNTLSATLGVQFGFNGLDGGNNSGPVGASTFSGAGGNNLGNIIASKGASLGAGALLGLGGTLGGTKFVTLLDALSADGATNILSTPTLVTMDNEEAEIIVGQNIPIITGSYTNTGGGSNPSSPFQTIQRQDVGLTLRVTPQINEGTTIRLAIEQEISSLAASNAGASDLITNKRSVTTNVMVEDNEVLVLGGLFENTFRDTQEKVPGLSKVPFIGRLFRHDRTTKEHQNLMIFIHPVILRDNLTASAYSREKYSAIRQRQKDSKILRRGTLQHRANSFPELDSIITKKPTPAEITANRQQARQQQIRQQQIRQEQLRKQQQLRSQQQARQRAAQQRSRATQPVRTPAQENDSEDYIPFIDDY